MLEAKARRGRPKGSGIDDTTRLKTIARMLAEDPSLKPTTAIKSIGITDPSAIRRLRDKFHEFSAGQARELAAKPAPAGLQLINDALNNSSVASLSPPEPQLGRVKHALAAGPSAARKVERMQRATRVDIATDAVQPGAAAAAAIAAIASAVEAAQRADLGRKAALEDASSPASPAAVQPVAAAKSVSPPTDPAAWLVMWSGLGVRLVSTAVETQLALGAYLLRTPPFTAAVRNQIAFNEMAMTMFRPLGSKTK